MRGRAPLYGLGAFGRAGVDAVLALLMEEMAISLRLLGRTRLAELGPACMVRDDGTRDTESSRPMR